MDKNQVPSMADAINIAQTFMSSIKAAIFNSYHFTPSRVQRMIFQPWKRRIGIP
jgi:hypothetical protein